MYEKSHIQDMQNAFYPQTYVFCTGINAEKYEENGYRKNILGKKTKKTLFFCDI